MAVFRADFHRYSSRSPAGCSCLSRYTAYKLARCRRSGSTERWSHCSRVYSSFRCWPSAIFPPISWTIPLSYISNGRNLEYEKREEFIYKQVYKYRRVRWKYYPSIHLWPLLFAGRAGVEVGISLDFLLLRKFDLDAGEGDRDLDTDFFRFSCSAVWTSRLRLSHVLCTTWTGLEARPGVGSFKRSFFSSGLHWEREKRDERRPGNRVYRAYRLQAHLLFRSSSSGRRRRAWSILGRFLVLAAENGFVRFRVSRLDLAPRVIRVSIRVNRLHVLGRGARSPLILPLWRCQQGFDRSEFLHGNIKILQKRTTFPLIPLRPLAYPVKVARRWRRVAARRAAPLSSRVRVGHVLVIPLLGRAGLHGDVDVTRVRARWNGGVVQRVNGSMGGARLAAEMALQPLGRFEFPRLVFLLEIQRFPRQHVLTSREILSWEAWESERIRISESFVYLLE